MLTTKPPLLKKHKLEIFESSSYLKVSNDFSSNIYNNTSLIVLTGDQGTGKTLVTRSIFDKLEAENHKVFSLTPHSTIYEMLSSAYEQAGESSTDLQKYLGPERNLKVFFEYLVKESNNKGPVKLFIDNAQEINSNTLCNLLSLLKWQSDAKKTLQIILIGLPQIKTMLASPEFTKLKINDPVFLQLQPLDTKEVATFVAHRLNAFGIEQDDFFPKETVAKIALYTKGIPSLVAILFDAIMAIRNSTEQSETNTDIVDEAVNTFSLTWATESKHHRLTGDQQKKKVNKSKQISFISEIRGKVTDLFSQNKTVSNKSTVANGKQKDQVPKINISNTDEKQSQTLDKNNKISKQVKLSNEVDIGNKKSDSVSEDLPNHHLGDSDHKFKIQAEGFNDFMNELGLKTPDEKSKSSSLLSLQQNIQVDTMNRGEQLNKVLKALQSGSPDVEAVALISEDGLMVASALPQDLDEIRVGGMSATLLSLGTRSSAELRRGKVEEIIVRGEHGYTVMLNAGRGTLLLVVANQNAKLGLIFFDMHDAIEKITTIL